MRALCERAPSSGSDDTYLTLPGQHAQTPCLHLTSAPLCRTRGGVVCVLLCSVPLGFPAAAEVCRGPSASLLFTTRAVKGMWCSRLRTILFVAVLDFVNLLSSNTSVYVFLQCYSS